jgi:WD40 repeat protein
MPARILVVCALVGLGCSRDGARADGSAGSDGGSGPGGFVPRLTTARDAGLSDGQDPAPCGEWGLARASALAYSADGAVLAVAGPRLRLLSTNNWQEARTLDRSAFLTEKVRQLAFVANGTVLAGAIIDTDVDQPLGFWRVEDGAFLYALGFTVPTGSPWHQRGFSRTPVLALTDGTSAALWNVESRSVTGWIWPTQGRIAALALSEKADVLALVEGENRVVDASAALATPRISLWDVEQPHLLRTIPTEGELVIALALSSDSKVLATVAQNPECTNTCDTTINFYRVFDGQWFRHSPPWQAAREAGPTTHVRYLPGDNLVAVATTAAAPPYARTLIIRTADAAVLNVIQDASDDLVFSPDGRLALTGDSIEIRDVTDGTIVDLIPASTENRAPTFSRDGQFLASVDGNDVVLWRVADGTVAARFPGLGKNVQSLAFSPDGQILASGGKDGMVRMWGVDAKADPVVLKQGQPVTSVVFSPDGNTLATGDSKGNIYLRETKAGTAPNVWNGQGSINTLAYSPDGKRLVSGGSAPPLRLWDAQTGHALTSASHGAGVVTLAFSPDGARLASAAAKANCGTPCPQDEGDPEIRIWRVTDSSLALESTIATVPLDGPPYGDLFANTHAAVWGLAFASGGDTLLTAGPQNAGHLYQVSDGATVASFGSFFAGTPFAAAPDGTRIVLGSSPIQLWCAARVAGD